MLETIETHASFGGTQGVYRHKSNVTGTDMNRHVERHPKCPRHVALALLGTEADLLAR